MRTVTIRNLSPTAVGVCGKSIAAGSSGSFSLGAIQGNAKYSDQLATLTTKGIVVVYLEGVALTVQQVQTLDAPISADMEKEDWQNSVKSRTATPPGSPAQGDRYIVIAVATGLWAGKETDIATWTGTEWSFVVPDEGMTAWVEDEDKTYTFNTGAWIGTGAAPAPHSLAGVLHTAAGLTPGHVLTATGATTFGFSALPSPTGQTKRQTISFQVAGAVSAATEQGGVWFAPAAAAIVAVYAYRKSTAGTGGSTLVDVNIGGTTIFTTQTNRPEIAFDDADGLSKVTTIEAGTLAADNKVTVDVDSIDTGGAPSDLTVEIVVEYSA